MIHDSPKRMWSSRRPSNGAATAELKRQVLTSEMPYFNTPSPNSDVAGTGDGQPEADESRHDTPAAGGPVFTYGSDPVAQVASPMVPAIPSPTYLPAAAPGPQAGPPDVLPTWSAPPESAPPQPQAAVSPPWNATPGSVPPVQPAAVSPPPPNASPPTAQVPQPQAYTPAPTWSPPSPTPTVAEQPQAVTVGDTNLVNNPPAEAASAQGGAGNPSSSSPAQFRSRPRRKLVSDESSSSAANTQSAWWASSDSATTSASATYASVMGAKASVQTTAASTSTWSDGSATALSTSAPSTWLPAPSSTDSSATAASWSSSWSSSAMDSSSASPTTMATSTPAQVAVPTTTNPAEPSISPLTAVATASSTDVGSDGAALPTGAPNAQNRRLFANTAAHVGIAVGAVIVVACLVALGAWLYRLGRRNRQQRDAEKLSWPFDNQANNNASGNSFEVVRARTARPAQDTFDYGYHFGRDLDAGEPKRTPSWYESQSSRSAGPSPIRNPFAASISPTSAGSGGTRGLMDLSLLPPPLPLAGGMYDSPTLPVRAHAGPRVSVPIPPPILPGQPATPIIASPYSNRNLVRFRPGMEGGVPASGSVPSLGERSVEERQRMLGPLQVANYAEGDRRTMSSAHSSPRTLGQTTPRMGLERPRFLALQDGGLSHPWEAQSATDSPSVYSSQVEAQTPVYPLATPSELEGQTRPSSPPADPWTTSLTATLKSNIVNAFNTIAALRGESTLEDEEARDKFTSLPARSVLRAKRRSVRSVDWQADHSEAESASSGDITRWSTVCSTRAERGGVVIEETMPGRGVVHIAQGDVVSPTRARAMREEAAAAYGGMSRSASGESVLAYYGAEKKAPRLPSIVPMSRGSTEWSQRSAATVTSDGLSRNGSEDGNGWLTEDEKKAKVILKERRKRRSMMGR